MAVIQGFTSTIISFSSATVPFSALHLMFFLLLLLLLLLQIMDKLYELDPNGSVLAFADMMRKQIVMPAHLMDDLQHEKKTGRKLFAVSFRYSWHASSRGCARHWNCTGNSGHISRGSKGSYCIGDDMQAF